MNRANGGFLLVGHLCFGIFQHPLANLTMSFKVQYSTMSPTRPFDIIALIIDIVGANNDTDLLKEFALVSYSFHQICSKHYLPPWNFMKLIGITASHLQ